MSATLPRKPAPRGLGGGLGAGNGELVIASSWLTESGITAADQLEFTTAPGILHLGRREEGWFRV